jgi:hypothetical protein
MGNIDHLDGEMSSHKTDHEGLNNFKVEYL